MMPIIIILLVVCFITTAIFFNKFKDKQHAKAVTKAQLEMQAEQTRLQTEKHELVYILDSIKDCLFVVNEQNEITLINSAACSMFHTTPNIVGKKLNYLTNDKILTFSELEHGGKTYQTNIKRLPGTNLTMTVLTDITGAKESAKQREGFFTNASHELKTPLTAIKGFSELAEMHNKDKKIKKFLSGINRETTRMASLISDMLRLSELENAPAIEPIEISLADVIEEAKLALSITIQKKEVTFETEGDAKIMSEPEHIYEVVKNLIENAVRYNNPGGKVFVKVESDKKITRMTVSDTGIGISHKEQMKIFERFYRVEKSRTAKGGGTGLGLAIVKHTCALYGWKVELKSKPGVGTDVIVEF